MTLEEAQAALTRHRKEIDVLDLAILDLLNQRTRVVEQIGAIKREMDFPVYEPRREDEVFRNVIDNNPGPLSAGAVRRLFERVVDEMRTLQRERMEREQNR